MTSSSVNEGNSTEERFKSITSKKLEVEWVYLDDEGDEEEKYIYTFKRIE